MSDMTNQLDAVNTEIAKQLVRCEDSLRVIAQEYNAWTQTSMFAALDPATKARWRTLFGHMSRATPSASVSREPDSMR